MTKFIWLFDQNYQDHIVNAEYITNAYVLELVEGSNYKKDDAHKYVVVVRTMDASHFTYGNPVEYREYADKHLDALMETLNE